MMQESSLMTLMIQSIAALAVVLAVFAGLVWALRKLQHTTMPKQKQQIKILQRLHLDARNSVVAIEYHNQHYLLGVGQAGIQKITQVSSDAIVNDDNDDISP